jgi:hypothetical protein
MHLEQVRQSVSRSSYLIERSAHVPERRFLGLAQEQNIEMRLRGEDRRKYRTDLLHQVRVRALSDPYTKYDTRLIAGDNLRQVGALNFSALLERFCESAF